MKKIIFILSVVCYLFSSCTSTQPLMSGVTPSEITDLNLLDPHSYIYIIKKGNKSELDDSLSAISRNLVKKVVKDQSSHIPITGEIILTDSTINKNLEKEFEKLILTADRSKNISNLKITPTIDKILEANNVRFGLLVVSNGFTRTKGNYGKQVAKGAGLAILTLGMVYTTPVKAYSTLYVMIVDSKDDNISFYRKSFLQDREPLDENILTKQVKKIFDGYFWTNK